jgi:ABC-2 type transport system permease protein
VRATEPIGAAGPVGATAGGPLSAGVIHDIGYQRYTGPRLGRAYAVRSLYLHSLRTAFGLGRSGKAKVFPWIVVGLVFLVAVVAVVVRSQSGRPVITYLQFSDDVSIPVLLFLAIVAPELVSRDLRAHTLPLYFSRPLRRSDYALAKLAAMISAVWLLLAGPLLLLLVGGLFSQQDGWHGAWHEVTDFLGGASYAAICAVVFSSIAVLVASLASRRAVAAAAIVAVFLVTSPVVGVLMTIGGRTMREIVPILNPVTLVDGVKKALYNSPSGVDPGNYGAIYGIGVVVLVAACVGLLLTRYRKVAA